MANFYNAAANGDVKQMQAIAQKTPPALVTKTRKMFCVDPGFGGENRLKVYQILLDLTPFKVAFDEAVKTKDSSLILAVINHFGLDFDPRGLTPELNQRVLQLNFSPNMPEDYTTYDFELCGLYRQSVISSAVKCSSTGYRFTRKYVGFFAR